MVGNDQFERPFDTTLLEFQVADFQFQQNFIVMFKKVTHFFLKMTCVPTIGTLTLDLCHMLLSRKKLTNQRTKLKMNRFVNPKYNTHPPASLQSKNRGTSAEQPAVNNNELQKVEKTTEIKNHEP